ncbi:hypothetical protein [Tenacibaculum discolor]|uniref:hypothetical protein n=1 Tax=Tenacibaculum discolor TaxID=361581 RepID=UPI003F798D59
MPIDYFSNCKTSSKKESFGICDDQPPLSNPAYIDENTPSKWIGIVENKKKKHINFNAIDNCLDIKRGDGKMDKRCDGLLSYDKTLIFTELKEREGGQWLKKGREQLTATIKRFKQEVDINQFNTIEGYVCNNLRPQAHSGQAKNIQQFKDDTGYILHGKQRIKIE